MYRGTTPVVILHIKNDEFDLSEISICHVAIESEAGNNKKIIENPEIDVVEKNIMFELTQEDTLAFNVGKIKIQLKIKLNNGSVIPSKIIFTTMSEILEEDII